VPIPETTKASLSARLQTRCRERWPELATVSVRTRGNFAYVDGVTLDGEALKLCRLSYLRSASTWGFAIYLASKDGYENSLLPTGSFTGAPEDALDCACGLYLGDPTAWVMRETPKNL
jgi:hypothetical protein